MHRLVWVGMAGKRRALLASFSISAPQTCALWVLSSPLGSCVAFHFAWHPELLYPGRAQGIEQVAETVADQAQPLAQRTADFIKEQAPVVAENAVPMAERASEIAEGVAREVRRAAGGAGLLFAQDERGGQG